MTDLTLADLRVGFRELRLAAHPVIVHTSLKSFGAIQGGAETLLRALLENTASIIVPTFTYKTMLTPEVGPPNNGLTYGADQDSNRMVIPFHAELPADPLMGRFPETLRLHPGARRSLHPIQSFAGIHADAALDAQTLLNPLAPISVLAEQGGWVLLLGTDHTVNTSIHYAERLAGRRQFTRWALLRDRVIECPGFPGDSSGFQVIAPDLENDTRFLQVGDALVQAVPIKRLFEVVRSRLKKHPLDLLCQQANCERCQAIRETI
jgi:aminoglycoside 3-N-acetyltransferase